MNNIRVLPVFENSPYLKCGVRNAERGISFIPHSEIRVPNLFLSVLYHFVDQAVFLCLYGRKNAVAFHIKLDLVK